ncbi:MAG: Gfo/Idh/MocA family oxidoreductase [Butyrivibrio sp.]|nr:Gfo/Idh/MocA family oxidoreductase [Butyrivibrio sp.]
MFGRLRVGIMGTGKIAGIMAETLKGARGAELYAVGSRAMENAQKFSKSFSVKKVYGSYEELVADPKVDLIYIATPHSEHFENAKLALNAGKHVLCEKAFMLNEAQASEIFKLAEEKKLLITEAIWTRYMPMRAKIMEVLASNVIGEPTMLTANLGYNIIYKNRINDPHLGGGALLDLGVYVLNFASMVFGDDVSDIASICTFNNLGVDMQDSITLRYSNGRMAVLNASVLSNSDRMGIIHGTKGYMVIDNINNPEGITVYDANYKKAAYYKRPKQKTGYEYEVEACVKAISQGWLECPEMPHAESLKMLNMMDFIRKSNNIVYPAEIQEPIMPKADEQVQNVEENAVTEPGSTPTIGTGIEKLQTALGLLTDASQAVSDGASSEQGIGANEGTETDQKEIQNDQTIQ